MAFNINTGFIEKRRFAYLPSSNFETSYLNNFPEVDFGKILLASYISTLFILVALHFPPWS
jgi:hypothetical protein